MFKRHFLGCKFIFDICAYLQFNWHFLGYKLIFDIDAYLQFNRHFSGVSIIFLNRRHIKKRGSFDLMTSLGGAYE